MSGKKTCFVIGAIGKAGSAERKHADMVLNYIIKPAAAQCDYDVLRGDASSHSGMITVDVITRLLDADLVIADLSFLNPNVFYELGLRHVTREPTIHIASHDTVLPFDNADHRAIVFDLSEWSSHQSALQDIARYIANIGNSTPTNPFTIAQAHRENDDHANQMKKISFHLKQLETRVGHLTDMPESGHITRAYFKSVSETNKIEILEIARSIRQRIDEGIIRRNNKPIREEQEALHSIDVIETKLVASEGSPSHIPDGTAMQ